jgi:hypothetical protein
MGSTELKRSSVGKTATGRQLPPRPLPLRELEPLARTLLAVLLALVSARVAREIPCCFQAAAEFGIELDESPRNAEARRVGLTGVTAAIGEDKNIELFRRFCREKGLPDDRTCGLRGEIFVIRATVNGDRAIARAEENAGYRFLPTAGSEMLNKCCH